MSLAPKPIVLQFVFSDFENFPNEPGDSIWSDEKQDDDKGHDWALELYPRGLSSDGEIYVGVYLRFNQGDRADIKASFILRDAAGGAYTHMSTERSQHMCWGVREFEKRSTIIDGQNKILSAGALVIDVVIQIIDDDDFGFEPANPALKNMQKLFGSDHHADVEFEVGKTIIPAHKLILQMNAPILAEFCGKRSPVAITGTTVDVFRAILRYVYGGDIPSDDIVLSRGKEIIEAANRFEIVYLKMAVETALVKQRVMDVENVADWLVFADSKSCPLLKECTLSFITCTAKDVLAHESSANLKESPKLMEEVMLAMSKVISRDRCSWIGGMTVDYLRARLDSLGLDVDGSKETLLSRLRAALESEEERIGGGES